MPEKFFSAIDIFGLPILLNFSKTEKAKSSFGGFCSLLFFGFFAWSVYNSSQEFFVRQKPQIIDGTTYSDPPRPIEISSKSLPLAFAVRINQSIIDTQFCKIMYYTDSNKTQDYELESCTPEHFVIKADLIDYGYNLSDYKCLPILPEFSSVLSFSVHVSCSQQNGIEQFFSHAPEAVVFYPVNGFTMHDFDHPLQVYYNDDYMPLVNNTNILYSWSLSHLSITTDDGWLTVDEKVNGYIQIASIDDRNYPAEQASGVEYQFTVSKQESYYQRSYKKIQNVLAEVGGLANAVFTIFMIMITPYARIKFSEAYVNELFEVTRKKEYNKHNSESLITMRQRKTPEDESSQKLGSQASPLEYNNSQGIEMQSQNKEQHILANNGIAEERRATEDLSRFPMQYGNEGLLLRQQRDEVSSAQLELKIRQESQKRPKLSPRKSYSQPILTENSHRIGSIERNNLTCRMDNALSVLALDDIMEQIDFQIDNLRTPDKFLGNTKERKKLLGDCEYYSVEKNSERKEKFLRVDSVKKIGQSSIESKLQKPFQIEADASEVIEVKSSNSKKPKKSRSINISIFEYMWSFVSRSKSLKEKMIILNEGLRAASDRLDVLSLLKKMRDIDKMKGLLIDKEQLFLFDRTPRPEIMNREFHWYLEESLPYNQMFNGVEDQMISVRQRIQDRPNKSEIDKRLLTIFSCHASRANPKAF